MRKSKRRSSRAVSPSSPTALWFVSSSPRLALLNRRLQGSGPREDYTPNWEFEYANLKTKGWQVSQLFPLATDPEPQTSEAEIGRLKKAWRTWTASPTKP